MGKVRRVIDASKLDFKKLNRLIRKAVDEGCKRIELINVNGQRYIGGGIRGKVTIMVHGTAGNDLGFFMNGPTIIVEGNVGDGAGNTMNKGTLVVRGNAGDVVGYSMRGGEIFVRGDIGYRAGIHMKEYGANVPVLVVGGLARDFLGEYMAGGRIIILGMNTDADVVGNYIGTGMHGGKIYVRGRVEKWKLGVGAKMAPVEKGDEEELREILKRYAKAVGLSKLNVKGDFVKIVPTTYRPYGAMYALHTLE